MSLQFQRALCILLPIVLTFAATMAVPSMARGEHGSREIRRAFRGAQGWAAETPGGRGGQIIRVTTLDASGPGSLREAVTTSGPRIVVFEVGGVIDLAKQSISIDEPFLTVAGQTAPSPGITLQLHQ